MRSPGVREPPPFALSSELSMKRFAPIWTAVIGMIDAALTCCTASRQARRSRRQCNAAGERLRRTA